MGDNPVSGPTLFDVLEKAGTVLLDTADAGASCRKMLLFDEPVEEIIATRFDDVGAALLSIEDRLAEGFWIAGHVTYEAGYAFEPRLQQAVVPAPLLWLGVYNDPRRMAAADLDFGAGDRGYELRNPRIGISREKYLAGIGSILDHVREGDVYQINYTFPFHFDLDGDPRMFYRDLCVAQPVPYAAFMNTGQQTCLSLSPELFFERRANRIVTRPMKGTAPASSSVEADVITKELLYADPKNRAENLMIVDLLRNDLSRCCVPGSVRVPRLFDVHRYPSVLQMTSTIEGVLREGCRYLDIFRSLFPCGSVTGAPKIRAMEIIKELEPDPRGIYCGAIGYISPDNEATFSVAIRTIVLDGPVARMGTGSGIVWDSNASDEFEECLLKTRFVTRAVGLPQ